MTATGFCFPPSIVCNIRNLGSYQWYSLVINQSMSMSMAGVVCSFPSPPGSCKGFLLLSAQALGAEQGGGGWLLKAFAPNHPLLLTQQQKLGGEGGGEVKQESRSLFLTMALSLCIVLPCISIWFLFKVICFKLPSTTSSLSLCSSAYRAQANHFQMLRHAASAR